MDRPNYPLNPSPEYNTEIPKILDTDPVRASSSVNPIITTLMNNTHFVKLLADTLDAKLSSLTGLNISFVVDTFADLPDTNEFPPGMLVLVRNDETRKGKTTIYEVIDGEWVFLSIMEINLDDFATIDMLNATIQAALASIDLGNLDVAVSSRAPAATSLTNTVWTNNRAAALDQVTAPRMANLDAAISSRAPANTALSNGVWTNVLATALNNLVALATTGVGTRVNMRVQRGTVQFGPTGSQFPSLSDANITIASVNPARSYVVLSSNNIVTSNAVNRVSATLVNNTTLRLQSGSQTLVFWQVVTFD